MAKSIEYMQTYRRRKKDGSFEDERFSFNKEYEITSFTVRNGTVIDLTKSPLKYGGAPGINKEVKDSVRSFENRRAQEKIEYGTSIDKYGNVLEEVSGDEGSVGSDAYLFKRTEVFSHVHPREGNLGGTFSPADIHNFSAKSIFSGSTYRAVAPEGVYVIQKESNFNYKMRNAYKKFSERLDANFAPTLNKIQGWYDSRQISKADADELFRRADTMRFVALHNWLLSNQKNYGYKYGLERLK